MSLLLLALGKPLLGVVGVGMGLTFSSMRPVEFELGAIGGAAVEEIAPERIEGRVVPLDPKRVHPVPVAPHRAAPARKRPANPAEKAPK